MNKAKLTAICHNISKESGLPFNSVMLYYFLESILKKLAQSKYCLLYTSTVGIVAIRMDREYIGIDINKDYCQIAKERIEKNMK